MGKKVSMFGYAVVGLQGQSGRSRLQAAGIKCGQRGPCLPLHVVGA